MVHSLSPFTRIKFAVSLTYANYLAGKKKYVEGIGVLTKTFCDRDGHFAPEYLPLLGLIRYTSLCQKAGRMEESFQGLNIAIEKLDRGIGLLGSGTISKADREYLYFYCRWLACLFPAGSEAFRVALVTGGSFETLDLPATTPLLKSTFPIPPAAGRYVDTFISANMPQTDDNL